MDALSPILNGCIAVVSLFGAWLMFRHHEGVRVRLLWGSGLRIEEAKRLMTEQPDLKLHEVAERCGFSSPVVFSRIFARETGIAPSKWAKVKENRAF